MVAPVTRPAAGPARRLAAPLGLLAGAVASFAYVGLVDPNHPGHYPVCPLYALTGVYCPGCGGLRCAHAVATGHLGTALQDNALAVVAFALCAVLWVRWVWRARAGRPAPALRVQGSWGWVLGALVVAFTVARNLPFGAALAP
ncbi:DUF2752 domain-containing protein [Streptomyces fuscigenes]|uniref:DUF2752 domain-containing protein n=1 Tax=Streptomyces fuscigenes TaxID=1528880 RepID=UPI001F3D3CFA|nr:DUF2752 domain-containing protein [Streptomyces fuscigenes]MCF3964089.1 DUF2752 domain-containing protein [Streptomyces fuscigenes]